VSGLRSAATFLTRVPVGGGTPSPTDLERSVRWFPVVGAAIGLTVAGAYAAALVLLPHIPAASVAIGLGMLLTGALHEDGLADTFDALGAGNRDDALRIMKDPTHGTYGVAAIAVSVVLRVGALGSIDPWAAAAVLPAAHALSRSATVVLMTTMRPASADGLGAAYADRVDRGTAAAAIGAGALVGTATIGAWVAAAAILSGFAVAATGIAAARRFGGITGDVLGAAQQMAEVNLLVLGAAVVAGGWPSLVWWR
jgi:adenosylcobinamide-GDP ribazoletransferase